MWGAGMIYFAATSADNMFPTEEILGGHDAR